MVVNIVWRHLQIPGRLFVDLVHPCLGRLGVAKQDGAWLVRRSPEEVAEKALRAAQDIHRVVPIIFARNQFLNQMTNPLP